QRFRDWGKRLVPPAFTRCPPSSCRDARRPTTTSVVMPQLTPGVSPVNPLQDNIARLRRYAETVGGSLPEPGSPLTASIERSLDEVRRLVQETIAATGSPVRIGVVGEFDAGKSLLLGALIGDATALPVSHLPTTGNITALSLRSQPGLTTTPVSGHTIEW